LQVHDDYKVEIFALTTWLLWNRQNLLHLGKSVQLAQMLTSLASGMLQDFISAQDLVPMPTVTSLTNQ